MSSRPVNFEVAQQAVHGYYVLHQHCSSQRLWRRPWRYTQHEHFQPHYRGSPIRGRRKLTGLVLQLMWSFLLPPCGSEIDLANVLSRILNVDLAGPDRTTLHNMAGIHGCGCILSILAAAETYYMVSGKGEEPNLRAVGRWNMH